MRHSLLMAMEEIDAAVFSGDTFESIDNISVFEAYLHSWFRQMDRNKAKLNEEQFPPCMPKNQQIRGQRMDLRNLETISERHKAKGYPEPRWIFFCIQMISCGFTVNVHRAKTTKSKYVYVTAMDRTVKVRFSDHKASAVQEEKGDSDLYVGIGNKECITTGEAIHRVRNGFAELQRKGK